MTDLERRLRAAMESAVASQQPPRNLIQQVRRRHRRYTARVDMTGAAAVAVVAVLVPVSISAYGHGSAVPAGPDRAGTRPTVYVAYPNRHTGKLGAIIPISIATNKPGKPIRIPVDGGIASTLNGRTLYVATGTAVIPVKTATNKPGKPIHLGTSRAYSIDMNPNGKTAYVTGIFPDVITPINTATNKPRKPIHVTIGVFPAVLAFTPDGKTLYVGSQFAVTPISTATGKVGKPIHIASGVLETAITPDGKTLYVASDDEGGSTVTPVNIATNTAGKPIHVGASIEIALTPDGKTLYAAGLNKVVPISTATNTPGKPIRPVNPGYPSQVVIAP